MTHPSPSPDADLSAECALAQRPAYKGMHGDCRQTKDIPLPRARGILLQRRCGCSCHLWTDPETAPVSEQEPIREG